jgi:hypothetical protein
MSILSYFYFTTIHSPMPETEIQKPLSTLSWCSCFNLYEVGPVKEQFQNMCMPAIVASARYSLVKGEGIARFVLSTRLCELQGSWRSLCSQLCLDALIPKVWDNWSFKSSRRHWESWSLFDYLHWWKYGGGITSYLITICAFPFGAFKASLILEFRQGFRWVLMLTKSIPWDQQNCGWRHPTNF